MSFVDASVIVAIVARESDWEGLATRLGLDPEPISSPIALWEATIALGRVGQDRSFDEAEQLVQDFIRSFEIRTVPITPEIGALAIKASRRFGRGRHPAALNLGDCFAYACARAHGVPLLFKGEDFPQTDIEPA